MFLLSLMLAINCKTYRNHFEGEPPEFSKRFWISDRKYVFLIAASLWFNCCYNKFIYFYIFLCIEIYLYVFCVCVLVQSNECSKGKGKLLDLIAKRGPNAFDRFIYALVATDQDQIVRTLDDVTAQEYIKVRDDDRRSASSAMPAQQFPGEHFIFLPQSFISDSYNPNAL